MSLWSGTDIFGTLTLACGDEGTICGLQEPPDASEGWV